MQDMPDHGLFGLTPVQRLAFEMALHEEAERRAMEGELEELETGVAGGRGDCRDLG